MKYRWSTGKRKRGAGFGLSSFRFPTAAVAVVFSLLVHLLFLPYHQATLAASFAPSDVFAVASELKATFGDAAAICVQGGDKGAPAPHGQCDDQCPLCRFSAEVAALVAPDAPAVPARLGVSREPLAAGSEITGLPARPHQPNQARAPPLTV